MKQLHRDYEDDHHNQSSADQMIILLKQCGSIEEELKEVLNEERSQKTVQRHLERVLKSQHDWLYGRKASGAKFSFQDLSRYMFKFYHQY